MDLPDDLPYLYGDPRRVKQILLNILSNAIKFSKTGGEVRVAIGLSDEGNMCFDVIDQGIGIDPEDLEQVMEPFHQAGDALTRSHDGTGLGLHIVKSLVELHEGEVKIESELGEGTSVHLQFPSIRVKDKKALLSKPVKKMKSGGAGTKPDAQSLH